MAKYFNAPVNLTNLTLILFFLFYSTGTLLWGPLSDRYGRKPVLLAGLTLYTMASFLCAFAGGIYQLIIFRVLQAIGASAAGAVSMAIVKDVYNGRRRETVLALVQSMVVIAPIIAPVLGAFLLNFTTWRGVFWTLAGAGILALAGGAVLEETIGKRYTGTVLQTIGRLGVVLKNPGFTSLLMVFSLTSLPFMAYLAASSYIYIDGFGLTKQEYSYYFALNALCSLLGPLLYMQLSGRFKRGAIIMACFAIMTASGLLVCGLGSLSPWAFAAVLLPSTIAVSGIRPPSTHLMLEQQQEDIGSASSLMGCFAFLMGSIGMLLISFEWGSIVFGLGTLNFVIGLICLTGWLLVSKRSFIKQIPDTIEAEAVAGKGR